MCDLTSDSLSAHISEGLDLVSLFFVLSAIHPGKMVDVLTNLFRVSFYDSRVGVMFKLDENQSCYSDVFIELIELIKHCQCGEETYPNFNAGDSF